MLLAVGLFRQEREDLRLVFESSRISIVLPTLNRLICNIQHRRDLHIRQPQIDTLASEMFAKGFRLGAGAFGESLIH